jgi:acyl-CoA hydrolase
METHATMRAMELSGGHLVSMFTRRELLEFVYSGEQVCFGARPQKVRRAT